MAALAEKYQKKLTDSIFSMPPDTYIGAVEEDVDAGWILNDDDKMEWRNYSWVPGAFKCFDEGVVNARDHWVRLNEELKKGQKVNPVNSIDITVDQKTGIITIYNDGNGIDVEKHPKYDLWIPEMIFGHLRSSTNYKKDEQKIVGGKNGFGFKLVLIYSKWGMIETVDHVRGKKYTQEFFNNLSRIGKPKIRKSKHKPYTKVSFLLDFERFGIPGLTDDMYKMLHKRTFDIAAITDKTVKVRWNNRVLPVRTFEQYIDRYVGKKGETKRFYEKANERWEYAVCLSPLDEFAQVSFVNGIHTKKGGKHVDYILNQIVRKCIAFIEKKKKVKVKPATIKEQLMLFVNCVVVNPTFDSQTKVFMNKPISKFGSTCSISDKFISNIIKLGVMETALLTNTIKEKKAGKKTDGKKTRAIRGIPKLIDANWAGGPKSSQCTIIFCEGDSAKAGIVSGLSREDRNLFGVFPLKGKPMNANNTSVVKINANEEINNIKKILGLEVGKKYKTAADVAAFLRYGKVMFMTDQDLDGSHIKGLCINIFHSLWKDLVKIDSFLGFMNTPILKATKGKKTVDFYNEGELIKWKQKHDISGWKFKYYKGLGTSTSKEFKEYFKRKKFVYFEYKLGCNKAIDLVFNKKRSDDRKNWLGGYDKESILDTNQNKISYGDFIHREMIHFSKYDCERSIPNGIDGLKISQRKALFGAFKRNLTKEIKVAQLSGYISEHAAYHHGEVSMQKTIVGLAQEYIGSNNIALLMPKGQFGTRLEGGKDSASPRYIFTYLNPITRILYPSEDEFVLNYLEDDGQKIEPDFYAPIIPMILVNGGEGIGTGFSSKVLCYNPRDIIQYLLNMMSKKDLPELKPFYEGFSGKITQIAPEKWSFQGIWEKTNHNTLHITELPIGVWIQDFKTNLEKLMAKTGKAIVKNYKDMSTDTTVDFTVCFMNDELNKLEKNNKLEKTLRLITTKSTSNQYLFDNKQQIKKYMNVEDIIHGYFPVRFRLYEKRKEYMLKQLQKEIIILSNKARFIDEQCKDLIDLRRKTDTHVTQLLTDRKYDTVNNTYKYLTSMPISSVIEENYVSLMKERDKKSACRVKLEKMTVIKMWSSELKNLAKAYDRYCQDKKRRT